MIKKCDFSYRKFPQNYHGIVGFQLETNLNHVKSQYFNISVFVKKSVTEPLSTFFSSQIDQCIFDMSKMLFMKPEDLVINFSNNKYYDLAIFMLEISMQQGSNRGVTEILAKNTINFKLR